MSLLYNTTVHGVQSRKDSADDKLLSAIALVESGYDHAAVGKLGERGAWQFTAETWADIAVRINRLGQSAPPFSSAFDPKTSRFFATMQLAHLLNALRKRLGREANSEEVYAAWNLGLSGFARCGYKVARCPNTTRSAARRVANLVTR